MTLIGTIIGSGRIVMVGDSAITLTRGPRANVLSGASKIQHATNRNVGFAIWGFGYLGPHEAPIQSDRWLAELAASSDITSAMSIAEVAEHVSAEITPLLEARRKFAEAPGALIPWALGGIHVAGWQDGEPQLWHVTTRRAHGTGAPTVLRETMNRPDGLRGEELQVWDGAVEVVPAALDVALATLNAIHPDGGQASRLGWIGSLAIGAAAGLRYAVRDVDSNVSRVEFSPNGLVEDRRHAVVDWSPAAEQ